MSEINSFQSKEEEKKENIPEIIEKEKTNMKITIIPKVKINGSIPNREPKQEIQNEKETPKGLENQNDQEQKSNDEQTKDSEKKENIKEIDKEEKRVESNKSNEIIDINNDEMSENNVKRESNKIEEKKYCSIKFFRSRKS